MLRRYCYGPTIALLAACGGCLIMHDAHQVVREDEPRQKVEFESLLAERAFQARALDTHARELSGSSQSFKIPFLILFKTSRIRSENAYYNDQIAACDTDGDGRITEDESLAFNADFQNQSWKYAKSATDEGVIPAGDTEAVPLE